ncbi:MAG: 4-hydroxy-tetrahydrodipicolinate reductase [Planctomycetaceae bacterium]|nr:4-hydroxy-tetrahydrodipicolinate reductase [Planctomycetaceae bacterium]
MANCKIAINGATGRMGKRLIVLGMEDSSITIVSAIDVANHPKLGTDAGEIAGVGTIGVPLSDTLTKKADVMIDFSSPLATDHVLESCLEHKTALVLATTGLSREQEQRVRDASRVIPILWSPNTGLAVNVAMKLAQVAAKSLAGQRVDVEILERHHHFKVDAPSGTALKFGEMIAKEMGQTKHQHGREGRPGERPADEIGYHAIRVGDNPGEHTIIFAMLGELIEITVRVTNRDCYAVGALAAAKFLVQKSVGLYSFHDMLVL